MTHWPKNEYGKFYNGDSYLVMNTYKKPDGDVSGNLLVKEFRVLRVCLDTRGVIGNIYIYVSAWFLLYSLCM